MRTKVFHWNNIKIVTMEQTLEFVASNWTNFSISTNCFIGTNIKICSIGFNDNIGTKETNCSIRTNIRIRSMGSNLTIGTKNCPTEINCFIGTKCVC